MNELTIAVFRTRQWLRTRNYPFMVAGSFVISVLGTMMVLAYHPENLSLGFIPMLEFALKFTGLVIVLVMAGGIAGIFGETYQPVVMKNYKDKKTYLLSLFGLVKNAKTITSEHTNRKLYIQTLFEELIMREAKSIWRWLGNTFVFIQKHINDYNKRMPRVEEEIKELKEIAVEHERLIKEVIPKKNAEIESKNKKLSRVQRILSEYQKKYAVDEDIKKRFPDGEPL